MSPQRRERVRSAWLAGLAAVAAMAGGARAQDRLWKVVGTTGSSQLGHGVAIVGDLDGDGLPDVVASEGPAGGKFARFLAGGDGALLHSPRQAETQPSRCGDLNGDGVEEVLLDLPGTNSSQIHSGRTGLSVRFMLIDSPVAVGDIDGDAVTDIAGYAEVFLTPTLVMGEVRVFSGKTGASLLVLAPTGRGRFFGRGIAPLGDRDGDGVPEIAVTVDGTAAQTLGEVAIFSLAGGTWLLGASNLGGDASVGRPLSAVGDLDGDGFVDLVTSNPDEAVGAFAAAGVVRIVSGASLALIGRIDGAAAQARLHVSSVIGDIDGDGLHDFAISNAASTTIWCRSGRTFGRLYAVHSTELGNGHVAGGGDLDGDGLGDFVMGDRTQGGVVTAERGRTAFLSAYPPWRFRPPPFKPSSPARLASGLPTGGANGNGLEAYTFHFLGADLLPGSAATIALRELDGAPVQQLLATGTANLAGEWGVDVVFAPNDGLAHVYGVELVGTDRLGQPITTKLERFSYR